MTNILINIAIELSITFVVLHTLTLTVGMACHNFYSKNIDSIRIPYITWIHGHVNYQEWEKTVLLEDFMPNFGNFWKFIAVFSHSFSFLHLLIFFQITFSDIPAIPCGFLCYCYPHFLFVSPFTTELLSTPQINIIRWLLNTYTKRVS